jgi:hypothetical protein
MNFFGKSYNEIENELNETKTKIQGLEEKIEYLIQQNIHMSKILYETTHKLQILEEKTQKNTSSLISFTHNSTTKFIDINCTKININYSSPYDTQNGFIIMIDDIEIHKVVGFSKVINQLKNIKNIHFEWNFPIPDSFNTKEITGYFKSHFDIIKQLTELNKEVNIIMSFTTNFPFEWLKYIFKDIHIEHIVGIEILYSYHIDKTDYITDIITSLNEKVNKKIIFKNLYKK